MTTTALEWRPLHAKINIITNSDPSSGSLTTALMVASNNHTDKVESGAMRQSYILKRKTPLFLSWIEFYIKKKKSTVVVVLAVCR